MTANADPPAEQLLVENLRAGKDEAFEQLVRAYGGTLLAVARRIVRNEEEARDVLQESFLKAFRSISRFRADSALGTWLHRITVNTALEFLRRRTRKEPPVELQLPEFLEDGHQADPAVRWPDQILHSAEVMALVRAAIDALPDSHRTVLLLRDIEEMSTAEAAEALRISRNAVKVRLHRARQALRQQIDSGLSTNARMA